MSGDNGTEGSMPHTSGAPATQRPKRQSSAEIQAMAAVDRILTELSPAERRRVVAWMTDKVNDEQREIEQARYAQSMTDALNRNLWSDKPSDTPRDPQVSPLKSE